MDKSTQNLPADNLPESEPAVATFDCESGRSTSVANSLADFSTWHFFLLALAGVFVPLAAHGTAALLGPAGLLPSYQTGSFGDRIVFGLTTQTAWPFFPLMLFSICSFWLYLRSSPELPVHSLTTFGIFTGIFVAGWFHFLLMAKFGTLERGVTYLIAFLAVLFLWSLDYFYQWCVKQPHIQQSWPALVGVACIIAFALTFSGGWVGLFALPFIVFGFLLFFSTHFAVLAYGFLFFRILYRFGLRQQFQLRSMMLVWLPWFAVYFAAIRYSLVESLRRYEALPNQPTGCFVATAAAQGHASFVNAVIVTTKCNEHIQITRQLQRLKAFELLLMVISPRLHSGLRRVYNVLGPSISARITNPLLADFMYVLLKPAEWIAWIVLHGVLRKTDVQAVERLYIERSK